MLGTLVNPTNLRERYFAPLLRKAGLPTVRFHARPVSRPSGFTPVRFHALRHTCATLLLPRNVNPKIISEMLGHASISITLDTYSHVLLNMQDRAVKALEDAPR